MCVFFPRNLHYPVTVTRLAKRGGLLSRCGTRLRECVQCGHTEPGGRSAAQIWKDGKGFTCHSCGGAGDIKDFESFVLFGKPKKELDQDEINELVRSLAEAGGDVTLGSAVVVSPTVDPAEFVEVYDACVEVKKAPLVCTYLKSRGIRPSAVQDQRLARALVRAAVRPCVRGRMKSNYRLVLLRHDHQGDPIGLHTRSLDPMADPKSKAAFGSRGPGVYANGPGLEMLKTGVAPIGKAALLAEGEMDFVVLATRYPEHPVLGYAGGWWSQEILDRIPSGTDVVLRGHHDKQGLKYMGAIVGLIGSRCALHRPKAVTGVIKGKPTVLDENDKLLKRLLPANPMDDALPWRTKVTVAAVTSHVPVTAHVPGQPEPFDTVTCSVPFQTEWLPGLFGEFVGFVSESSQTPPALAGYLLLSAVSASCLQKVVFQRFEDAGWQVHPAMYFAVAMPPSSGKTPVFRPIMQPIVDWERAATVASEGERAFRERQREVWTKRRADVETKLIDADDPDHAAELAERLKQLQDSLHEHPTIPATRLVANNVTPESLALIMSEHHGRAAIVDDEGAFFRMIGGHNSRGRANPDLPLKGWDGGTFRVDRVSMKANPIHIPTALLAIGLAVQPFVLQAFINHDELRHTGLVARFLMALPPSRLGQRDYDKPRRREAGEVSAYADAIRVLLEHDIEVEEGQAAPKVMELTANADRAFVTFQKRLDSGIKAGGVWEAVREAAGKMDNQAIKLAGLLQVMKNLDAGRDPFSGPIKRKSMETAITICAEFAIPHALCAIESRNPAEVAAVHLVNWLQVSMRSDFTEAEARKRLKGFGLAAQTSGALQLLDEHGYTEPVAPPAGKKGRPKYERNVNPLWKRKR